ncbi:MAG TPA: hypothetical protein VFP84_27170 [Kofleriaceae bacterium]|nr:hypothetical protein [Kofleriaceae bacterium]
MLAVMLTLGCGRIGFDDEGGGDDGGAGGSPPITLELLAGELSTAGNVDGLGVAARFIDPSGIAIDGVGNLFVADAGNNAIRKIGLDGRVTTLAGSGSLYGDGTANGVGRDARFNGPQGVAVDGMGNVFVADTGNHTIRKITPDGMVTTLAGGAGEPGTTNGTGSVARFTAPRALTVDAAGMIYVADTDNHAIRKVTPDGEVTTYAGSPGESGTANDTGTAARFRRPVGLAYDATGNLFVVDAGNYIIRKITPDRVVSTFAGVAGVSGNTDGAGANARFAGLGGLAIDGTGLIYVVDGQTLRTITPDGLVSTGDAHFASPDSVAFDAAGTAYITDGDGVRRWTAGGGLTAFAGATSAENPCSSTDGPGADARFCAPVGVAVDGADDIYVAESGNEAIRKITVDGNVTTFASGTTAGFVTPVDVAIDRAGTLYVADNNDQTIRKVTADATVTTLAGKSVVFGSADGIGTAARFMFPLGVIVGSSGDVYVADAGNCTIRQIDVGSRVTTLAGTAKQCASSDGVGVTARFLGPKSVAADGKGNLYVADEPSHTIRKIDSSGTVTTLAGSPGEAGSSDGTGAAARFFHPTDVVVDGAGNVYVTDLGNAVIRRITPAGVVTTLAGTSGMAGVVLGTAPRFADPERLAILGDSLVITDGSAIVMLRHAVR